MQTNMFQKADKRLISELMFSKKISSQEEKS